MGLLNKLFWRRDEEAEGIAKAQSLEPQGAKAPEQKAWDIHPWEDLAAVGSEAHTGDEHLGASSLSYKMLERMAATNSISPIIQTRINQLSEFTMPAEEGSGDLGFAIKLRDRSKDLSRSQRKRANELTDWMLSCGDERIGFELNLTSFTQMLIRDSLVYDQGNFEIVRTRGGDVAGFIPVDASTIRRAFPGESERDGGIRRKDDTTAFVQVIGQEVVAEWTAKDMAFCIRRPRTKIAAAGYGYPELQELIRTVTSLLHGEMYNSANFTNGMHTAGVLALKSKIGPKGFRAFRREFYAMLSGAHQSRKTPLIQLDPDAKEELQSINLSQSNRDMEFKEWMAYLQKNACAIFQIDPAELGYIYGAEGQSGALNQQGPEARILASKEKGLRPLVRAYFTWLNRWVMQQVDPEYMIVPVGLDQQIRAARFDSDLKKAGVFVTVNEMRTKYGMEPIPEEKDGGAADMIMDPTYVNAVMTLKPPAPAEEEGVVEGEPGMEAEEEIVIDESELTPEQLAEIEQEADAYAEEVMADLEEE